MNSHSFPKRQKGIALLIVLTSLLFMSAAVVNFVSETQVRFNIAYNNYDRLRSYYLAISAINFSKTVLRYDREVRELAKQKNVKMGKALYELIPIDTNALRTLASLPTVSTEGADEEPKNEKLEEIQNNLSMAQENQAKEFLSFEGNFRAKISSEDSKLPLNAFYILRAQQPEYDRLKYTLAFLLLQKPFESFFKDRFREAFELAHRIADYIDANDSINDFEASEKGSELSAYNGLSLKPKNAKLISLDELMLVPGMTDDILKELKKYVTVYKSTDKINLCRSEEELLRAAILAYTQKNTEIAPLKIDDQELLDTVVSKVKEKCPDGNEMTKALNEALGISTTPPSGTPPTSTGGSSGGVSKSLAFSSMLTTDEVIFVIEAEGQFGEAVVKIKNILNIVGRNPAQWKSLYWRVE